MVSASILHRARRGRNQGGTSRRSLFRGRGAALRGGGNAAAGRHHWSTHHRNHITSGGGGVGHSKRSRLPSRRRRASARGGSPHSRIHNGSGRNKVLRLHVSKRRKGAGSGRLGRRRCRVRARLLGRRRGTGASRRWWSRSGDSQRADSLGRRRWRRRRWPPAPPRGNWIVVYQVGHQTRESTASRQPERLCRRGSTDRLRRCGLWRPLGRRGWATATTNGGGGGSHTTGWSGRAWRAYKEVGMGKMRG